MNKQTQSSNDMLIALYYNIKTAMQNITNVLEKVEDTKLKQLLRKQLQDYTRYQDTCEDLAQVYGIDIMDNTIFKKMQMWMSVNMSILFDRSNRKIASINIFGTTMGIIDLIGLISDNKKANAEFLALANQVLELEKSNVEKLKPFLLKENQKKKQPKKDNDATSLNQEKVNQNNNSKTISSHSTKKTNLAKNSNNVAKSKANSPTLKDDMYTIETINQDE